MKARILILLCFLLCGARAVAGGGTELGGIVSLEFNKSLPRHFNISLEEELRFDHDHPNFDRWLNSLGVDYDFYRGRMSVGLRGDYIRRYNNDGFFENRVRTALVFSYSEQYHRFKLSYRSKIQSSFMDESTASHRVNPLLNWRNRLSVAYQLPNSRFKYALSSELFWLLNDPKYPGLEDLRTTFAVDYRLSRRHYLSVFVRMDHELSGKNPKDVFYLGMAFKMKY